MRCRTGQQVRCCCWGRQEGGTAQHPLPSHRRVSQTPLITRPADFSCSQRQPHAAAHGDGCLLFVSPHFFSMPLELRKHLITPTNRCETGFGETQHEDQTRMHECGVLGRKVSV